MRQSIPEQRASVRQRICTSGNVSFAITDRKERIALILDVSANGIFFYANCHPSVGEALQISFTSKDHGKILHFNRAAKVVRVVKLADGAATGIAAELLEETAKAG